MVQTNLGKYMKIYEQICKDKQGTLARPMRYHYMNDYCKQALPDMWQNLSASMGNNACQPLKLLPSIQMAPADSAGPRSLCSTQGPERP